MHPIDLEALENWRAIRGLIRQHRRERRQHSLPFGEMALALLLALILSFGAWFILGLTR